MKKQKVTHHIALTNADAIIKIALEYEPSVDKTYGTLKIQSPEYSGEHLVVTADSGVPCTYDLEPKLPDTVPATSTLRTKMLDLIVACSDELRDKVNAEVEADGPEDGGDAINPDYYKSGKTEVIDIVENLSFCRGNAVKYIVRAGRKSKNTEVEDLRKALWYIQREIDRLENRI